MKPLSSLGLVCAVILAGCSSPQPNVKVRESVQAAVPTEVEESEALLSLGNVGLALEGFRKTLREQPQNTRAMNGIAQSYTRMGRFDLARDWYERALAIAPRDLSTLIALAGILDRLGRHDDAVAIRSEIARQSDALATFDNRNPILLGVSDVSQITPGPMAVPRERPDLDYSQRAFAHPPATQTNAPTSHTGPRLERLSLGEVALVTNSEPVWTAKLVKSTPQSSTFQFVAVRPVARLLNAARVEGLAARTRAKLGEHGWKRIEIGDAPAVRETTLVLYPVDQAATAKKLAAHFGFAQLRQFNGPDVVVLLGRDAARRKISKPA